MHNGTHKFHLRQFHLRKSHLRKSCHRQSHRRRMKMTNADFNSYRLFGAWQALLVRMDPDIPY